MATTTNYGWTTPDDTSLVKNGAAAIRTLGSSADTTVKNLNPGTTAGDIDYYTSSTAKARIAIGTAGQVLRVNSGATAPEWATASAGGMTQLATGTLSGASVAITSISGAHKDLILVLQNAKPDTDSAIRMRFNNDTNNRYKDVAATSSNDSFGDNYIFISNTQDSVTALGLCVMRINQYANTVSWKTTFLQAWSNNETTATNFNFLLRYGAYNQTTAITEINLFPATGNFTSGNYILYGVS